MNLTPSEKKRYSRHLLMPEVGNGGQQKLKEASVLVIGAGGLGCPALQYLAAAGVGRIGIIDHDVVDESNLQRQVLFTTEDVGKPKAERAAARLKSLNPQITIEPYTEKLTNKNALFLFPKYDIILDGTDNFSTRYLVNDASLLTNKPLVYGAIYKFEGQVSVFNYDDGPTYRCLFPTPPSPEEAPACNEVGVLGVLPGIIGTWQATEVLKMIIGIGDVLSGKLMMYNALDHQQHVMEVARNEEEVQKVLDAEGRFTTFDYDFFCQVNTTPAEQEIDVDELKSMLQKGVVLMVDIREKHEQPEVPEFKALNIPLSQLETYKDKIPKEGKVVVFCQSGGRSKRAINFLKESHTNLINLKGGVSEWLREKV